MERRTERIIFCCRRCVARSVFLFFLPVSPKRSLAFSLCHPSASDGAVSIFACVSVCVYVSCVGTHTRARALGLFSSFLLTRVFFFLFPYCDCSPGNGLFLDRMKSKHRIITKTDRKKIMIERIYMRK